LYERLVVAQVNPEFELYISGFNSKKMYVTNNLLQPGLTSNTTGNSNIFQMNYTIFPHYLNQILGEAKLTLKSGMDALIILKRNSQEYRLSARNVIEGKYDRIRLFPEDQIIIKSIPYRAETAIIMGEVVKSRLYALSPSNRKTLSEALYSDQTFHPVDSDTSQIYLLRPQKNNKVTAYHLDASNPSRLMLANKLELRPGDIIYVASQPVTTYNRALFQIFGAYAMTIDPGSVSSSD